MNRRKFLFQLFLLTFVLVCLVLFLNIFPVVQAHLYFLLSTIAFYMLLSIAMFLVGAKAAVSKDKNAFTRVIMVFTFIKLLLTILVIISYTKFAVPDSNFFIIPFFLVYFAYTIFETLFLTRLGKIKAR